MSEKADLRWCASDSIIHHKIIFDHSVVGLHTFRCPCARLNCVWMITGVSRKAPPHITPPPRLAVASHNPDLKVGLIVTPLPQTRLFCSIRAATSETCPPLQRFVAFIWVQICVVNLWILTPVTQMNLSSADSRFFHFPGRPSCERMAALGGLSGLNDNTSKGFWNFVDISPETADGLSLLSN